jgi:hypothetical protein
LNSRLAERSEPGERKSECGLANLLNQSLMLYLEIEKAHWHLRLNPPVQAGNFESEGSTEAASEWCIFCGPAFSWSKRISKKSEARMTLKTVALRSRSRSRKDPHIRVVQSPRDRVLLNVTDCH